MKIELAPSTRESFEEICQFLLPMAKEVAIAKFDLQTARENGWRILDEGMTFVVRDDDDSLMGTCGMVKQPLWYARWPDDYCLIDSWFYVSPLCRGGRVAALLVATVRELGRQMKRPTFIRKVNPNKRVKLIRLV